MLKENSNENDTPDTSDDPLQEALAPEFLRTMPAAEPAEISMATFSHEDAPSLDKAKPGGSKEQVHPPRGFDILEEIGRGGMGIIYRANQRPLVRQVALKTLKSPADEDKYVQFLSEALISGCLDHPNIVPIYALEENDEGWVVLAMKLIDGISWVQLLHPDPENRDRARTYSTEDHLEILLNVCNAVAFAHSREIIHRDLKLENVMIGEFGEVLLTDWGLAVSFRENPEGIHRVRHRSRANSPAGTPAYMAPEMASGDGNRMGPWTDVYLLGAILYEILTGSAPHKGTTLSAFLEAAKTSHVTFPEEGEVPELLQTICLKAMEPEPTDRYQSVEEFSRDLRAYLGNRQSMTISEHAGRRLEETEQQLRELPDRASKDTDAFYRAFFEIIAAYDQALLLWNDNQEARRSRDRARMQYAQLAFEQGDFRLARSQLQDLDHPAAHEFATRIERAMEKQRRSSALTQKLRRSLLATLVLASALLLSIGFALYSTREMGLSISSTVKNLLVDQALESLRTDHAAVSAEVTRLNIHKAELALQAYRGALESVFESAPPPLREPVYTMQSVDTGINAPPGLTHQPLYEHEGPQGKRISNPVTFEEQTFFRANGLSEEEARPQVARVQRILPTLVDLRAARTAHVIRYFCGFESGLYVAYPGHGNMPENYDNRVRPWYREGRSAEAIMRTRPYVDVSSQQVVVSLLQSIRNPDGSLLGVAGVDVDATELLHTSELPPNWANLARVEVATPRIDEDGRRWLELKGKERTRVDTTDSSRMNLTSWDVDFTVVEDSGKPSFDQIFKGMFNEETGVVRFDDNGVPSLCAFAPFGIDHSSLFLIVPEAAVTAGADDVGTRIKTLATQHIKHLVLVVGTLLTIVAVGVFISSRRSPSGKNHRFQP